MSDDIRQDVREELRAVGRAWTWFLALGIVLVGLGAWALSSLVVTSLATAFVFGIILLAAGTIRVYHAFQHVGEWGGFWVGLIVGLLQGVAGLIFLVRPDAGAPTLTLLLAFYLLVAGFFQMIGAVMVRFRYWPLWAAGGAVSSILGVAILGNFAAAGMVAVGLFLGIELVFAGVEIGLLAIAVRPLKDA